MEPRSLGHGLLIQRVHDPRMQLRRSSARYQVPTYCGARPLELLNQSAASGTVLNMPFNIRSRDRVDLAVEVSLHS
jgi:hypothetical protein